MRKKIAVLLFVLCLVSVVSGVFAMTPRIRFPEWNKTNIKITDWDPIKGILTITVVIEANRIPIEKAYSQPYLQSNFNKVIPKIEKENIKQGDKAVFTHRLNIKSNTTNWVEMDIRAMPDIAGLKVLLRSEYADNPAMRDILEMESDQIKNPVFIGTSMPILVRDDIALNVTPEIAFVPSFIHNNQKYYIWLPLDTAESKTTNSAIKIFKTALEGKDLKKIEAAGQNLIERFNTEKRTIVFKRGKGDNFAIPTKVALEMLRANIVSLKAILNNNTDELEKFYSEMKPCYTKGFIAYNLYALFKSAGNTAKASKYKNEALTEKPAWPLLKND